MRIIQNTKNVVLATLMAGIMTSLWTVSSSVQAGSGTQMSAASSGYSRTCQPFVKKYCSDPKSQAQGVNQCLIQVQDLISTSCQREVLRMEIARGVRYR